MPLAILGGGPTGLRAAEIAANAGIPVTLFDAKPSVGRKFLVAGRGGLNLTKSEPLEVFAAQYRSPGISPNFWPETLRHFDPAALQRWAGSLGIETFVASTGRVYPIQMKGAPLLRRWVQRLRKAGVLFRMHHHWTGLEASPDGWKLFFKTNKQPVTETARAVILALGGSSWPETGSDGLWPRLLEPFEVRCTPWTSANCGWELQWPEGLLQLEGSPLKNVAAHAGTEHCRGELMLTRYGLEGGLIYQLGPTLRTLTHPTLFLDLKPDLSPERLLTKLGPIRKNLLAEASRRWRLDTVTSALLRWKEPETGFSFPEEIIRLIKKLPLSLDRPRPIAEAISSAGGLCWEEVDDRLMLHKLPGVFAAGEMLNWEAPTGGYLLQGCFATGTRAAESALQWLRACENTHNPSPSPTPKADPI